VPARRRWPHSLARGAAESGPRAMRVKTLGAGPMYRAIESADQTEALGATTCSAPRDREHDRFPSVTATYITGAILTADGGRTAV
jgi:hypothetical protein